MSCAPSTSHASPQAAARGGSALARHRGTALSLLLSLTLTSATARSTESGALVGPPAPPIPFVDMGARHALVIGNGDYPTASLHGSPQQDARDVASRLRELGFDVTLQTDVTRAVLAQTLADYAGRVQPGDVSFFYYSGHALQRAGQNYLLPVDFGPGDSADVSQHALPLGRVLVTLEDRAPELSVVVLDAGRDNPFRRSAADPVGLAAVQHLGNGTLVAFSSSPDVTAMSAALGESSVYATALIHALGRPGVPVGTFFSDVGEDVLLRTHGQQVPWSTVPQEGRLCLEGECRPPSAATAPAGKAPSNAVTEHAAPTEAATHASGSLKVQFAPADGSAKWLLQGKAGDLICQLPCTAWVPPSSGYRLRLDMAPATATLVLPVPDHLAFETGYSVYATAFGRPGALTPATRNLYINLGVWAAILGAAAVITGIIEWTDLTGGSQLNWRTFNQERAWRAGLTFGGIPLLAVGVGFAIVGELTPTAELRFKWMAGP